MTYLTAYMTGRNVRLAYRMLDVLRGRCSVNDRDIAPNTILSQNG